MQITIHDDLLGGMPADWITSELQPALDSTAAWLAARYPLDGAAHEWHINTTHNWSCYYNVLPTVTYAGTMAAASFSRDVPPELNVKPGAKVPGLSTLEIQQGLLCQSTGLYLEFRTAAHETRDTVLAHWLEVHHPDIWQSMQLPPPPTEKPSVSTDHPSELPAMRCQPCGCHPCRRPLPHRVKRPPRQPSHQSS